MKLKENLEFVFGEFVSNNPTCGMGDSCTVDIINRLTGEVLWSGVTCPCGRGCGDKDCVRDDRGYHDTDIEQFRV